MYRWHFYKGRTKGEWQTARVGSETKACHKSWQLVYLPVYSHTCVMHPAFYLFEVYYTYTANLKFSLQVAQSVCVKKKYLLPRKHNITILQETQHYVPIQKQFKMMNKNYCCLHIHISYIYISQSVSSTFPGNRFSQDWSKKLLRRRFVIWYSRHKTWRWQMETKQVKQWHVTLWRMYLGFPALWMGWIWLLYTIDDIDVRSKSIYFWYTLIYCTGSLCGLWFGVLEQDVDEVHEVICNECLI